MQHPIESMGYDCCGARSWSLVIGLRQTVRSAIYLGMIFYVFLGLSNNYEEGDKIELEQKNVSKEFKDDLLFGGTSKIHDLLKSKSLMVVMTVLIKSIIEFVSGIILTLGVIQRRAGKLRIWHMIQFISVLISVLEAVLLIIPGDYKEISEIIFSVLFTIFCNWVVNIHRQELINALPIEASHKI